MKFIMKNKPIIGIIGKVQPKYDEDLWRRIDEVDEIRYLIVKLHYRIVLLMNKTIYSIIMANYKV